MLGAWVNSQPHEKKITWVNSQPHEKKITHLILIIVFFGRSGGARHPENGIKQIHEQDQKKLHAVFRFTGGNNPEQNGAWIVEN